MPTQCAADSIELGEACGRRLVAGFDGGAISSDAGAVLLAGADRATGMIEKLARCFADGRDRAQVTHALPTLLAQRVYGICLGYEDLNDHDRLRHDPVLGAVLGKLEARRADCAPLSGKSTLQRLEHAPSGGEDRYCKIAHDGRAIEDLFVTLFLEAHTHAPDEIVLDLDATDDPVHGGQEGRFFHGYYGGYCYLPLYIFCGRDLLCAKLRKADIDAAEGAVEELARIVAPIRARWPAVKIVLRADSGFCREDLMAWCEASDVDYVFGLARNARLEAKIGAALNKARSASEKSGAPARVYRDFLWSTKKSWSRSRRVVAKAEWTHAKANPRFVVTSLEQDAWPARALYEKMYCARGEMENRIKECQLDLFADRTSAASMQANQLRLWLASFAYVLMTALRRIALAGTALANATCGSIRLKLLKIGARVVVSVRRIKLAMASAFPWAEEWRLAARRLIAAAPA